MKVKLTLSISVILLAGLVLPCNAQERASPDKPSTTHTGKLQGRITNTSGEAVKDAGIVLTDTSTREKSQTKTDSAGGYTFSDLFPGSYSVSVTAEGYKPSSAQVTIKNGSVAKVDLKLAHE